MNATRKLKPQMVMEHVDVNEHSQARVAPHCIGLANGLPPEEVLRLATELGYAHIIQKNGLEYRRELQAAEILVEDPRFFFDFPVAALFNPMDLSRAGNEASVLARKDFTNSNQKHELLGEFVSALRSRRLQPSLIDDLKLITDEMFTNAVFNAPFIDHKTQQNANVSRHTLEVHFDPSRPGRMTLAADQTRLMVVCEDPYGSLNLNSYLSKIKATYNRGATAMMNFGSGGAGIGSYIIFNTGASLSVGVKQGRATIIACVLPLGLSNRKRALLPKHLHWIQLEEEQCHFQSEKK